MTAITVVQSTGEQLVFDLDTPEQVVDALRIVNDYIDSYEALKRAIKREAEKIVDEKGHVVAGVVLIWWAVVMGYIAREELLIKHAAQAWPRLKHYRPAR